MSSTLVPTFTGTPVIDAAKVATIQEWLKLSRGDADKADLDDEPYYSGQADAFESVLTLICGAPFAPVAA